MHNSQQPLFSKEILDIQQQHLDEHGIRHDHQTKRYTIDKDEWDRLQAEHVLLPVNSKFFPEYGVLFNDHGYLLPGLKKTYLFVAVEIPKECHIQRVKLDLPDCDEWAGRNSRNWQGTHRNIPAIKELIHQKVCADVNTQFHKLKADIDEEWRNLTFQVNNQIPAFVPNKILHTSYGDAVNLPNGEFWYSRYKPRRSK